MLARLYQIALDNNFSKAFIISPYNLNSFVLRNSSIFVKSSFSRNSQWAKNIVYFGLWFNAFSVLWLVFFCYSYAFIFSFFSLLWLLVALVLSISFFIRTFPNSYNYVAWIRALIYRN